MSNEAPISPFSDSETSEAALSKSTNINMEASLSAQIGASISLNKVYSEPGWCPIFADDMILVEVNYGSAYHVPIEEVPADTEPGKNARVQVRWCMEKGVRLADGSRPWITVGRVEKPVQEVEGKLVQAGDKHGSHPPVVTTSKTVSNPWTLEGQQIGAILQVMRAPERLKKIKKGAEFNMTVEAGDCCEVLSTMSSSERGLDRIDYIVDNKRTGARVSVPWNTFLPVGMMEICNCANQACRCVYVDYKKSVEFCRRENGH